jgi:hypothetical protein
MSSNSALAEKVPTPALLTAVIGDELSVDRWAVRFDMRTLSVFRSHPHVPGPVLYRASAELERGSRRSAACWRWWRL